MRVTGLDLSMTRTGGAWIEDGTDAGCWSVGYRGTDSDTIEQRSLRLRRTAQEVVRRAVPADLVVVERPAYGSTTGKAHDRAGLWWLVVARLTGLGLPVVEVSPATLKVYATGNGGAGTSKDAVLAAVIRRFLAVNVSNNDEADALVLAAMGARHLGLPFEDGLPATHTRAMAAVAWPPTARVQ